MKKQRNLDGAYFRVKRDGEWCNVCYSDMTRWERDEIAAKKARVSTADQLITWWRSMAELLADELYDMGEQFGIEKE